ncbi:MAG: 4-(cytidine 5'-diphospho)-2-C-methyl-D-erythritol kinase [Rhizomicrobium sp.]
MTSAGRVVVFAPAKVNLCLHVGNRRADGYHELESLVAFAALADEIRLERDDDFSLSVSGPFGAAISAGEDNLALRAARLLARKTGADSRARIHLEKNIPVAAGLGGGSADAAAVLRGLARLWNVNPAPATLHEVAASLGADVPVCLDSAPAWMEGKGEHLKPLPPLPTLHLLLVNPGVPVSTAQVFASLRQRRGVGVDFPRMPFSDISSFVSFLRSTTNDLEEPARAIAPVIGDILEEITLLSGVLLARMSGSGATCFGVFDSKSIMEAAMTSLLDRHPEWWLVGSALAASSAGTPLFLRP